jgi:hypothetical protein
VLVARLPGAGGGELRARLRAAGDEAVKLAVLRYVSGLYPALAETWALTRAGTLQPANYDRADALLMALYGLGRQAERALLAQPQLLRAFCEAEGALRGGGGGGGGGTGASVTGSVASSTASRTLSPEAALMMHWRRLQALAAAKVSGYSENELLKRFRRLGTRIWSKLDEKLGGGGGEASATARFAVGLPYLETPFLFPGPKWAPEKRGAAGGSGAGTAGGAAAAAPAPPAEESVDFFFAAAITARSDITATPR